MNNVLELFEEKEIERMAKSFAYRANCAGDWPDFAQEAYLILLKQKESIQGNSNHSCQKRYAVKVIYNHWKQMPFFLYHPEQDATTTKLPEIFYTLCFEHLEDMLTERARLLLRQLIEPDDEVKKEMKATALRRAHLRKRCVVPILSICAQHLGFKVSEEVKLIEKAIQRLADDLWTTQD
jgi:hypothetical protein